jgi:hypothetical protein
MVTVGKTSIPWHSFYSVNTLTTAEKESEELDAKIERLEERFIQ